MEKRPRAARLDPSERSARILGCAQRVIKRSGVENCTRSAVAEDAQVSEGLINRYYGNIATLRSAAVQAIVHLGDERTVRKIARAGFDFADVTLPPAMRKVVRAAQPSA